MTRLRGKPSFGEVVICRITNINPNSASAELVEYKLQGLIHVSEVASGWIRDIRQYIKQGQEVVAKVKQTDGGIMLSIKRVSYQEQNNKLKQYNLDQRAEKLLELAAKNLGKTLDQAYEEAGYVLQEKLGSLYAAFVQSAKKPENLLKYVSKEWLDAIREIAEKSIEQKEFELKAKLIVTSYDPDGISKIKELLAKAEKLKLKVIYIAAPEYLVKYTTKDPKKEQRNFEDKIRNLLEKSELEAKFEILKA